MVKNRYYKLTYRLHNSISYFYRDYSKDNFYCYSYKRNSWEEFTVDEDYLMTVAKMGNYTVIEITREQCYNELVLEELVR